MSINNLKPSNTNCHILCYHLSVGPNNDSYATHISQAAGACWYLLGIQRVIKCLSEQCSKMHGCNTRLLASQQPIFYGGNNKALIKDHGRLFWASNRVARHNCLESYNNYEYGAYKWVIYLVSNNNRFEKILMPIFWGLMTMR